MSVRPGAADLRTDNIRLYQVIDVCVFFQIRKATDTSIVRREVQVSYRPHTLLDLAAN